MGPTAWSEVKETERRMGREEGDEAIVGQVCLQELEIAEHEPI